MPDLDLETEVAGAVIGIDEAGRGPWAGPVTVAAVWLVPQYYADLPAGLDDSKKLSATKRARLYTELITGPHLYAVTHISVEQIDESGILQATLLGMRDVASALAAQISQTYGLEVEMALVDGNISPSLTMAERLVVKGDAKSCSIAAASIIAKQTRDHIMQELAKEYPAYSWDRNMGYGTRQHQDALAAHGATVYHRQSFAPIKRVMQAAKSERHS